MFVIFKTTVTLTCELDDIPVAVSELVDETLKKITLRKNSLGILLSDASEDNKALFDGLKERLGYPLAGCTTMGIMTGFNDVGSSGAALITMTSDEECFSVASSEPLTKDNSAAQVEAVYKRALDSLRGKPSMVMVFLPLSKGMVFDIVTEVLDKITGGLPVFGGVASSQDDDCGSMVFTGDGLSADRMAMVLISDAAKPVFSVNSRLCALGNMKRTITHSEGNVIYKVGEQTFVDFIKQFGLEFGKVIDGEESLADVISMVPLMIELDTPADFGKVPVVRTIMGFDMERGSGYMGGAVPQGSTVSAAMSNTKDLEITAHAGVSEIKSRMKKHEDNGYEYSLIMVVSCATRFIMLGNKNLEAEIIASGIPKGLSFCGLYCFGEICPIFADDDDRFMNVTHNYSFAIMAI